MFDIILQVKDYVFKNLKKIVAIFLVTFISFIFLVSNQNKLYEAQSVLLPSSVSSGTNYNSILASLSRDASGTNPILIPYVYSEILNSYDFIDKVMSTEILLNGENNSIYSFLADFFDKDLNDPVDKFSLYELFIGNYYFASYNTFNNLITIDTIFFSPQSVVFINQLIIENLSSRQNELIRMQNLNKISYLEQKINELSKDLEILEAELVIFLNNNFDRTSPVLQVEERSILREISVASSLLSSSKLSYQEEKLKQLEEMDTFYIINHPIIPVDHSYPQLILSSINFLFFFITTLLLYSYYAIMKLR